MGVRDGAGPAQAAPPAGLVVAVDGGGTKTDAVALDPRTGQVLGRGRGPGCSHQALGVAAASLVVDAAVRQALAEAGSGRVVHAACYLTGLDLPEETATMAQALGRLPWAPPGLVADNDVLALLRSGTPARDAVVVVCGTGINGAAITSAGRVIRILALGRISGDFGGGLGLAEEVLWHAARAEDGRGPGTTLRAALLEWTGRPTIAQVSADVHRGLLDCSAWANRVPDLLALAAAGDGVARDLVERQGREVAALAAALLVRAGLVDGGRGAAQPVAGGSPASRHGDAAPVPLVLGGGILAARDPLLTAAFEAAFAGYLGLVDVRVVTAPPVSGAALLALEQYAARRR